ncbi:uncharacterized protein TRUGW13939_10657 [Talaromyces rugulosus]|uniref:Uncharacterized protein n=1 Tax=Talaromyces rugulosus TaxID=121627 RepID=A0A7H8RB03_TALRU|nr:uncharacterized protein TRUGW13939_10657 [Talaromyces rugulosus]QKX63486.1 hypothetical protein TRUGW13939_10657 [Talaromyces rugulosus]
MPRHTYREEHPFPKRAFGRVLDDDRPVDDFENTVRQQEEQTKAAQRGPSPPNRAAATHEYAPHMQHQPGGSEGKTASKYRSVSKH